MLGCRQVSGILSAACKLMRSILWGEAGMRKRVPPLPHLQCSHACNAAANAS